MSFLAILLALVIEQAKPLSRANPLHAVLRAWSRNMLKQFDAGATNHGWVAWTLAVVAPALLVWGLHWVLWQAHPVLAFAWHALVLYATLGFRQFSHHFTDIRDALDAGDGPRARAALAHWRQVDTSELPKTELLRHVIEYSVLAAHRHVFGVLAWYTVLSAMGFGPAGAVLYRMAEFVLRYWVYLGSPGAGRMAGSREHHGLASPAAQTAAAKAWQVIDYVPSRITALAFAVVGSFEDAVDSWRNYANKAVGTTSDNDAVIIAATAGALNVRLGGEPLRAAAVGESTSGGTEALPDTDLGDLPEMAGREPEYAHLAQVVGLVWRSVVLWMVLLALLTLARLLG